MTTEYCYQLTVLAPESEWYGANHLAVAMGEGGETELSTFTAASFSPSIAAICTGVRVRVAACVEAAAQGPFDVEPLCHAYDEIIDKEAAQSALDRALIVVDLDPEDPPVWDGERMLIVLGADLATVKSVFNLQEIVE